MGKYYKSVKDSVTWQAARDACSSEGTILVELRTADEYQAIRPTFGKIMSKFKFIPRNIFFSLLQYFVIAAKSSIIDDFKNEAWQRCCQLPPCTNSSLKCQKYIGSWKILMTS